MASKNRDFRVQGLVLGGFVIPLGGDGISVRIAHGTVGDVIRGNATSIKTQPGQIDGLLTISVYPEDAASPILRNLYNTKRIPGAASLPMPGSYTNTTLAQASSWSDSHFSEVGDVVGGTETEVVTYQVKLIGLVTVGA